MPLGWLGWIIVTVAISLLQRVLGVALRPKSKAPDHTQPTSEAGGIIPVFYGVVELAPNTTWTGHFLKRSVDQYWRFYGAAHHIFCFGKVNELIDLSWDEKSARNHHLTHPSSHSTATPPVLQGPLLNNGAPYFVDIHGDYAAKRKEAGSMFGGNRQGGGVAGGFKIYWGTDAQSADGYLSLSEAYGSSFVSRWPRICYIRQGGGTPTAAGVDGGAASQADGGDRPFYLGANTSTPYPLRAVLRRTGWWETATSPLGQTEQEATLGYDANPAEVLYDLLTNAVYGLGRSAARMDLQSFIDAAVALRNETVDASVPGVKRGFGISLIINTPIEAGSILRDILDTIDASLATNPLTGLYRLKLIRDDYVVATLPVISSSNSWEFVYRPSTWADTYNEVRLTYNRFVNTTERRGFVEDIASAQDGANWQATGRIRTLTLDARLITDPDVARLKCERARRAHGIPLARCSWKMNREGYTLMQGDVVSADPAAFGVSDLILRITRINYGALDDGTIEVEAMQDVFNVGSAVYTAPPESGWVEPPADVDDDPDSSLDYPVPDWGTETN